MLKAYDYVEYSPDSSSLQNPQYFEKELEIAQSVVKRIYKKKAEFCCCPACRSSKISHFCDKWKVKYLHCDDCETVFVAADREELEQYSQSEELMEFRISKEYQQEAAQKREITWMESADWITFRVYRYLGKNTGLSVVDIGNRYEGYIDMVKELPLTGSYTLKESILHQKEQLNDNREKTERADIVLYLNQIQRSLKPLEKLKEIYTDMKPGALLFFSTRMGTGFDVLTLKEHSKIFPYEHVFLPSKMGMERILSKAGFEILEYSTPGRMDVGTVARQTDKIAGDNYFIRSLMKNGDRSSLAEFQRFLQKSGMSSYAQIVAQKPVSCASNLDKNGEKDGKN